MDGTSPTFGRMHPIEEDSAPDCHPGGLGLNVRSGKEKRPPQLHK